MKIIVIGAGIAGLSAAVYARECGYDVEVLEMQERAGGLATNWERNGYTFETCLHWLLGSRPGSAMNARWKELFDIDALEFVYRDEFVRIEPPDGRALRVPRNVDRLEEEWLDYAPEDEEAIRRFASDVRELGRVKMPWLAPGRLKSWLGVLKNVRHLPLMREVTGKTCAEYGSRFHNRVLRSFFAGSETSKLSAIALLMSLAWMAEGDAGYPMGGSQAVIRAIAERLLGLGGKLHCHVKVKEIVTEGDRATGVLLESGERMTADWVISAVDGHATIFEMLGGKYVDGEILRIYEDLEPFPSYMQVSLGVARDLSDQPGFATWLLKKPLDLDPVTEVGQLGMRFFHYDRTFAPKGKTAVTCQMNTRNSGYWMGLSKRDPDRYAAEKERIGEWVIGEMEKRIPGVRGDIEVVDVATPATVMEYTGNWQGSMEGWLLTPESGFGMLPNKLPGLRRFYMVGQWIMPGGGLPSGPLTARPVVEAICEHDDVPFVVGRRSEAA